MRKLFSLMAATLMSVAMLAGSNDLLWDYTQEKIPTTGTDSAAAKNGVLYYGGYVNDAPSTNNGLNGVKLNSGGWAYFEKANVAGKLKLTFANRKAQTAYAVSVYNATKEDKANPVKGTKIADTEDIDFGGSATIDLAADVKGVYIERKTSAEGVLSKIEFKEDVTRTFEDFEMIMCNMTAEYDFTTLPTGVTASGTFNGDQHGYRAFTITVPVDGTVKFTIGDCKYGNQPIPVKNKAGETITTLNYPQNGCYQNDDNNKGNVFTYNYMGGVDVLTFGPIQYCNYFKAEAAEITPCTITFKDQNGDVLGKVETIEGANFGGVPDTIFAKLPDIPDNMKFRGWYYTNGKKVVEGDPINGNTTIQAKVTPIEYATVGSIQTYDFANATFYPEDHETVTVSSGYYHDATHGWAFTNDDTIFVSVAGNAVIVLDICQYGTADAAWFAYTGTDDEVTPASAPAIGSDGEQVSFRVEADGPMAIMFKLSSTGGESYLHKMTVYNVENFLEKDTTTGYIMVPEGDGAAFVLALAQAEAGDKIFLPNGLYDLGETVLTTISKNNISIIGQSMDSVIIKNAPDAKTESIDKTATLRIAKNVSGTYIQDLTIQNALDYYKADNGRAVALWDQGTQTVCKNVKLLSYQDTYYSNLQKAVKYFEDCEIHGTVDFICGDGSVYFKNNLLYCEKRKKDGGGSDALTANNGPASDIGYVFESCTIKSECPIVSLGRAWNNTPSVYYLNTLVDYEAGEFSFTDGESGKIQRWTKELMNKDAWPSFGEYNTHLADGTVLTPDSNFVEFIDTKNNNAKQIHETVLSAEIADAYTMEYTLGNWAATAKADATQAVCETEASQFEADGIYLVEADGKFAAIIKGSEFMDNFALYDGVNYTVRKANARGGFGLKAGDEPQGIEDVQRDNVQCTKIFRNGQVIIVRDGKEFNVLGAQL